MWVFRLVGQSYRVKHDPGVPPIQQLFNFKNLESFSLRFEPAFYSNAYSNMNPGGDTSVNSGSNRSIQMMGDRDRTHIQETMGHARPSMPGLA